MASLLKLAVARTLPFLLSENTAPLELNAPFDLTANATLTNECPGEVVVVATADQLELAPGESTVVALEVSDENDNASTCEYTVYFVDDVAPILTPLDAVTLYTDASDCGQFELPDFASVLDVFDHSEYSLIQNPAAGTYFVVADVVEVELTATDVFGNTASTTLEVTIETPFPGGLPTDAVNVNLLLDCAWELPNYIPEAALSDACGSTWEVLQIPEAGTQLSAGQTYTVHFEMADAPGVSLASFEVTVEDSQAPVWDCPTEAFEVQTTANSCLAELDIPIPEVNDNCTVTVIELQSDALPTQASPGSYWVTYRAYDPAGNFSDCTFEVQVVDATPPALVCPDPVSIDLPDDGSGWAFPEASSLFAAIDCTPWADLIFTQSIAAGTVFTTSQQGVECDVTVTDAAGNMAQCTLVYTLIDQSAPQLQPIADQELDAGSMCSNIMPDYTLDLVILEGAESVINSVQSPSPGSPVVGSTPVNITVYAASGTSSELNFNVDLVDVYAPIIDCGGLQFIELTDACGYTVPDFTSSVTLSDNCSAVGDITLTQFVTPGSELYPWTSVQYVGIAAMDEAGNESMCNVQLWITDAMPPEITCVEHQEVLLSTVDVYPYPVPDALLPAVFDPCFGGTSLSASQSAFELEAGQTCTYFFYTSDGAGNEADCSYNLTLLDDVDPVVDALSDTTIFTFNTDCSQFTLPDFTPLVNAWDHSEIVEISQWPMPGDYSSDLAPAEVLVKVMDSAGNITYIGFTVHVEPTAPAFIPVSNDYIELGSTCSIPLPQYLEDNGFVDACGVFWPIVQVPSPGTEVFPGDFIEVEFYLADALDSAPVGSLVLTLVDAIAPEWTCPTLEPVFTVNEDDCLAQVHIQTPEVFDYCGVESIEVIAGLAAGSLPPGQYQVTFEATDPAGLTSTCSVDYSVLDNSAPVMECAQPVLSCEAVVSFDMPVVFDVCDDDAAQPVLVSDPELVSGVAFPEGITEVIFEATDAAGNSATCTTFVEVNVMSFDFEMPFDAICKSADPVQLEISGEGEATWGGAISASGVLNPNAIGPGEHVATLTVSDGTCEVTQDFPFTVDETPEVTFTNLPDMWCLDGGPVELLYETNPGATWEWTAGVGADGILDPTGMAVGTVELTLSGNLGSCVAEEMAVVELVEGISFTWTDLPSSLCSHNEAIPLEVNAPAGSTVDFNDVVTKTGTFDPQSWSAGEQTITVSVALPGCFASDSQTVTVVEPPTVFAGDDDEVCGPVTTVQGTCSDPFAAVSWSGPAGTSFSDPTAWMTTVTYNPMGGVDLTYTVTSGGVCTASDVVHLHFTRPPAQPDAGPDQDLELVSESSMEGFYQGPGKAHWRSLDHLVNLSDSSDLESPVTNLQHGINRFHLVASSGKCPPRVDSVEIRVNLVWQIPSGFSPNGDRTNDFFVIDGLDGPASLDVVNRWGERVYRAKNYHNQWDGRSSNGSPLPDDTYFYILKVGDQVFDGYIIIKR